MSEEKQVIQGLSVGRFLFGLFFVVAGIAFILMAAIGGYTLFISGLELPQWVFYLVAVIALLFGGYNARDAFRTWKCVACRTPLEYGEAFFAADQAVFLVQACEELNAPALAGLPAMQAKQPGIKLSLDYCVKCGRVGVLSATAGNARREITVLVKPRMLPADAVTRFIPLVHKSVRIDKLELDVGPVEAKTE